MFRFRPLLIASIALLVAAAVLLGLSLGLKSDSVTLTASAVRAMPKAGGAYRSINNWETIKTFKFDGVELTELLARCGVTDRSATVKVIAPDGYFWPKVGTTMTVGELGRRSPDGLVPIIAYAEGGKDLDPEPDGTGPLRYVAPQYKRTDVNKPSWVSNLRLVEVGPLPKGYKAPRAKKVPPDRLRVYGNLSAPGPVPLWLPLALGGLGIALLAASLAAGKRAGGKGSGAGGRPGSASGAGSKALALLLVCLCALGGACLAPGGARAATSVTFTMAQLKAMPAFSGHYTFLKQLEPYTYYEEDYKGVALSTILDEALRVDPGATGLLFKARDGYSATVTLEEARATFPNGLKAIVAYEKGGGKSLASDEGPLRLIVPQHHPGRRDAGGDANTPRCVRMLSTMEVSPVPGGVQAPSPSSVAKGSLAVFGSVSPAPAPAPSPSPSPSPAPSPAPAPRQDTTAPGPGQPEAAPGSPGSWDHRAVVALFGGSRGFGTALSGATLSMFLPRGAGVALRRAFFVVGSGR